MNRFRPTLLLAAALASGCAATSESYLADQVGYAVTRGRVTKIESLHSEKIETLSDGVAMTASAPARVSLRFEDDRTQVVEITPGMILVMAADRDYVLRPEANRN